MKMRRHFEAKAKESEAKDDFSSRFSESVDRHRFRPREVHYAFKFIKVEICPEDFPICIISSWTFLGFHI